MDTTSTAIAPIPQIGQRTWRLDWPGSRSRGIGPEIVGVLGADGAGWRVAVQFSTHRGYVTVVWEPLREKDDTRWSAIPWRIVAEAEQRGEVAAA